ncbi:MAG: GGDEF domain-containing phosphodiesterase [Clostridia bacterium]
MLVYNLTAEYSMLVILFVAFFSFYTNYKENTHLNIILKTSYFLTFLTIVFAIICGYLAEYVTTINVPLLYTVNTIYFILIPSFSLSYLTFCIVIASVNQDPKIVQNTINNMLKFRFAYIIILCINIVNGNVFTVTTTNGFEAGPWFNLPYIFALMVIFINVLQVFLKRKNVNKKNVLVLLTTLFLTTLAIMIRSVYPVVITTALMSNMNILAIHMFLINRKKSVNQLTGANNFLALRDNMNGYIKKDTDFSLYVISLRDFKTINKRNGFDFGDKSLKKVCKILFSTFNYEEVYRYRGEEFAILLQKDKKRDFLIHKALEKLEKPIDIDDIELINLNICCVRVDYKTFGMTVNELVTAAEYATSILKEPHCEKNYLYDTLVVKEIIEKGRMIQQIKSAIENRMFKMCYQPMYSVKEGKFTQAEALVRMTNAEGGIIYPSEFIDIAETTDLIIPMTYVILDIVCEDYRRLLDKYGDDLLLDAISVNFPYHIFLKINMEDKVSEILNKYNLLPKHIKIEITERTLISENSTMTQTMNSMLNTGFAFELDDFGVDYSNISTFLELPLNIIKIDRSVLLSAMCSENNKNFFKHLTSGISATGRIIIVEGVEDKDQLDFVFEANCEFVQGYIFSKPLFYKDFENFIEKDSQYKLINKVLQST